MAKFRQIRSIQEMLTSPEITAELERIGGQVLAAASSDPDPEYVASLRMQTFQTNESKGGRSVVQVGAKPAIGMLVEAERGTLARALGAAGG
jgi:hypothetical protein